MEPTGGDDFDRLMRRLAAKDVRFRRLNGRPEHQTRAFGCRPFATDLIAVRRGI